MDRITITMQDFVDTVAPQTTFPLYRVEEMAEAAAKETDGLQFIVRDKFYFIPAISIGEYFENKVAEAAEKLEQKVMKRGPGRPRKDEPQI